MFFEESDDVDDADIIWNELNLDWMSGNMYFVGIRKPPDDKEKEFEKFVEVRWKCNSSEIKGMIKLMTMMHTSSMTVSFLLKVIMWIKATMKRT